MLRETVLVHVQRAGPGARVAVKPLRDGCTDCDVDDWTDERFDDDAIAIPDREPCRARLYEGVLARGGMTIPSASSRLAVARKRGSSRASTASSTEAAREDSSRGPTASGPAC